MEARDVLGLSIDMVGKSDPSFEGVGTPIANRGHGKNKTRSRPGLGGRKNCLSGQISRVSR